MLGNCCILNPEGVVAMPPRIARLGDAVLRGRAAETWEAALTLVDAIDLWEIWLCGADPGNAVHVADALRPQRLARQALAVLFAHAASVPSFRGKTAEEIGSWFPAVPEGPIDQEKDAAFIGQAKALMPRLRDLHGELRAFSDRVAAAPLSALVPAAAATS